MAQNAPETTVDHVRVHVLGSGTPTPTPQRFGSAFAVEVGDARLMVDCGPAATHKLVKAGLFPTDITDLFMTHHHFDHNVDMPCLLLSRWDQSNDDSNPLRIRGPQPTEWIVDHIIGDEGAFRDDLRARRNAPTSHKVFENRGGTLPRPEPKKLVDVKDIVVGDVVEGPGWTMRTGLAQHVQPWLDSIGYRLETPKGSIVFTGDTQPCDTIIELAKDADMIFCMCWAEQGEMDECGEAPGQCGTDGAAKIAQEAGVKKLVLVHTGPHVSQEPNAESAAERVGKLFDGEVVFAEELMSLDL